MLQESTAKEIMEHGTRGIVTATALDVPAGFPADIQAMFTNSNFVIFYKNEFGSTQYMGFDSEEELNAWLIANDYIDSWGFLKTWQGLLVIAGALLAGWAFNKYVW